MKGMIDSPDLHQKGRGYSFVDAVRWFAERADLVLLLLDPEKPATTGETMEVFASALSGIEHKLCLVLNKMDTVGTMEDAMRVYGSVAWAFAKILATKDLPYIYTAYLPGREKQMQRNFDLSEFDRGRKELVERVHATPKKHADNMVTELRRHCEHLLMHARLLASLRNEYWWWRVSWLLTWVLLVAGSAGLLGFLALHNPGTALLMQAAVVVPLALLVLALVVHPRLARATHTQLTRPEYVRTTFERLYSRQLMSDSTDIYERAYAVVSEGVTSVAQKFGLTEFPNIKASHIADLEMVRDKHVQQLLERVHKSISKK